VKSMHPAALAAVAAAVLAIVPAASAQEPMTVAIRNARLVPVSGPVVETGTIVLSGGLIRAVGPRVEVPAEAVVIDGTGLTVYPGLIDAMTDFGLPGGAAGGGAASATRPATPAPARPVRGPQDRPASTPWVHAADEFRPEARRVETWRHGGFTSVVVAPSTGLFPGQAALVNLSGAERGEAVVRARVALPITMRPQGGFASFPGSLMGVVAYVRQVFSDTRHYGQLARQYDANPRGRPRPEYDRTVLALHDALAAKTPVLLPAVTAPEIDRMLTLAHELDVPVVLYGGHDAASALPRLADAKVPVLVSAKWPEKSKDADPDAPEPLRVLELRDRAPGAPAALATRRLPFAFYSDGLDTPKDMLANVRKAIDAGLSREAALRALTLDTATIFGVADRLGTLETGKIANVVVTTGDLFDTDTTIAHVFVDGLRFDVPPAPANGKPAGVGPATSPARLQEGGR